ncbi:MAG: hypothetical protein SGI89_14740, partial [bacterium]|nr:hypothetical protein [bacterium]
FEKLPHKSIAGQAPESFAKKSFPLVINCRKFRSLAAGITTRNDCPEFLIGNFSQFGLQWFLKLLLSFNSLLLFNHTKLYNYFILMIG